VFSDSLRGTVYHQMINVLKLPISWFSIFLYFMIILVGANSSVLCFGGDDHIMVEPALIGSNCGHPSSVTSQATSGVYLRIGDKTTQAHCLSCLDIPLLPNILNRCIFIVQHRLLLVKVSLIATFSLVLLMFAGVAASAISLSPLICNNFPLTFIRSVILLV
jgi:hypothetical protein